MLPKKLFGTLLLDIDECLVHAYEVAKCPNILDIVNKKCSENPRLRRRKFNIALSDGEEFIVIKRPHLDKLLNCAFQLFEHVVVWSAGRKDYVDLVVAYLFTHAHQHPTLVYTRDECAYVTDRDYHKPLSVIRKHHGDLLNYKTALFVDDKYDNFRDDPNNGICIPKFDPPEKDPFVATDDMLLRFIEWLMEPKVQLSLDVRNLDKNHVFETIYSGNHTNLMNRRKRFLMGTIPSR